MDALTVAKTEVDWDQVSFKHKTDVVPDRAENLSSHLNDVTPAKELSEEPDDTTLIVGLTSGAIAGPAKDTLEDIVRDFRDVFAVRDSELGATNQVYHHINTGDSRPIKLPPHRVAPGKLPDVKAEVQDMLQRGIIQPSNSPYSAPIVMVRKKDGSNRFCVDYRRLNEVTRKDAQPIPNIDQTLDALKGSKWFSSLDLASGYWQVEVAPEDRHKTAFVTPDGGLYEYKRMPFGLSNAPGTFQRLMNELFKTELHKYVLIFLDDILIYSPTLEEHADHVRRVMLTLRAANLKLKPKKCKFFQPQVEYLGHIIDQNGSRPDHKKVEAVQTWPRPTTVTGVKSFLGFCNYYRKFVKDFAQKAEPLTNLTKKYQRFSWDTKCETAFQTLKDALTNAPLLAHPDYNSPFIVDTDASNTQLGAVLSNVIDGVERPLVYASRVLSKTECQYATTKREALAVVQAVKWFKPYIWGLKFIIRTDHASLKWLFRQNADGMTFRMLQKLQEFDYEFVHRAGEKHGNADGLSRQIPEEQLPGWLDGELEQLVQPEPEPCSMKEAIQRVKQNLIRQVSTDQTSTREGEASRSSSLRDEQQKDSTLAVFRRWTGAEDDPNQATLTARQITREEASEHGTEMIRLWSSWDRFAYRDGVLHYRWQTTGNEADRLLPVIPWRLRLDALQQLHDSPVSGGHMAVEKTLDRIRQRFWWPGMRQDVERYIEVCKPCAARRTQGKKLVAELKPFIVGTRFHKVAADIIGPVTLTKGTSFKYILVMTDLFTKYVVTVPLANQMASSVAEAIIRNWFLRFGMPDCLHTDQGTNFCSQLLKDVCTLLGVDKTRTSAFHPQGNGQVERHNRVVADMLSKYCANNPRIWDRLVPYLTFVYNTTVHKTTGATPFSLVYGAECQYPIDLFYPRQPGAESFDDGFVDDLGQVFREAHQQARVTLGTNQRRVKDAYHKKVHGDPYREGMRVWLFCKHKAISKKFNLPWEGPYLVLERISDVTYKIAKEPVKEGRWQIVHYNRLKPYIAEAERPRRESNRAKQTDYEEDMDSEVTESEEDTKPETVEPRGLTHGEQMSKQDLKIQSPVKNPGLEIPANPFGSLCLGDSITRRLHAHEVADDCVVRGFSGIKIDELRRRLKQSDATKVHMVALCIGTNDILSGSATPSSMWLSYEELLGDVVLMFKPSRLLVCTLPPLEGPVVQHNKLVTKFNNFLKKQLEAWRQKVVPTKIEVIDVYKHFEGKNLMSRDGIHPNKNGLTTMTQLYRRAWESEQMTLAGDSDSEDEEQQFWLPKTPRRASRVPTSDTQGTPVVADETLTPGPLLSGGSHDGTVLETLQLGPSADPTGTPVEAE
ncbi:MAG: reverse transcriptase domain-containing protein, partial [Pseudomonadota bacterium]